MKRLINIFVIMFFFFNFIYVLNANAATIINAASCSQTDVESAIASASNGDTVIVPACPGGATWSTSVTVDKEITLKGQTTGCPDACIDNTLIIMDTDSKVRVRADNVRITGFTFSGTGICISIGEALHDFRIDHNKITGFNQASTFMLGKKYGVFDHNLIENCLGECIYVKGDGNQTWADGGPSGGYTDGTVYFESNKFLLNTEPSGSANAIDSGAGARLVFRYNTVIEDSGYYMRIMESHGHCWAERDSEQNAGTYNQEVYGNTFFSDISPAGGQTVRSRGGRNMYFNNTISGIRWAGKNTAIELINYETCIRDCTTCEIAAHETSGIHSNPWDGLCNNNDGNPPSDYPCPLQINNSYIWGNTHESGTFRVAVADGCENYIQEDRDFWDDVDSDGTGDTNFVSDIAANRLGTCEVNDAYWETDNEKLYKCTATNTWTFVYEPYPYPHPLTLGDIDDTTPPIITEIKVSSQTTVTVVFSELIEQASAENIGNYTIDNGITITQQPSLATNTVTLTVSALSEGITYTLTVNNVKDLASSPNTIVPDSKTNFDYSGLDLALIGLWRLDEGNGSTANDSSDNGNDGSINGAIWSTGINDSIWSTGKLEFDGANDYLEIGTNNFDANAGTVSLWVMARGFSEKQFMFGHITTDPYDNRIQLYTDGSEGYLSLGLGNDTNIATNIFDLDTGVRYHVVLTWDGANYNVYVNGSLLANGNYSNLSSISSFADIGNDGLLSRRTKAWDGIIDDVRIYNRDLSSQEITALTVVPSTPSGKLSN